MTKQFWIGFLLGSILLLPTNFMVDSVKVFFFASFVLLFVHIERKDFVRRIDNLLKDKGRLKAHIARFIEVNDRLEKEGRIAIFDDAYIPFKLRKETSKKRKKTIDE